MPPQAQVEELVERLGPTLPDGPQDPAAVVEHLADRARAGADRDAVGPVLRDGDRRLPPGRAGRGLAGQRVGPERRAGPAHPGGDRDRAGGERVAARPARPPGRQRGRVRHRRHDGQLHLPGRGPRRGAAPRRLGRRRARAHGEPGRPGPGGGGAARHRRPGAALPRASVPPSRSAPTARGGWTPPPWRGARGQRRRARRWSASRPATCTRAATTRSPRRSRSRTATAPGCTSTAPSGSSRPRPRRTAT